MNWTAEDVEYYYAGFMTEAAPFEREASLDGQGLLNDYRHFPELYNLEGELQGYA